MSKCTYNESERDDVREKGNTNRDVRDYNNGNINNGAIEALGLTIQCETLEMNQHQER